jgi:hypothetical protein
MRTGAIVDLAVTGCGLTVARDQRNRVLEAIADRRLFERRVADRFEVARDRIAVRRRRTGDRPFG